MNKKLFLGMFAAATMLFATSCSNDELDGVQSGNEATISFNLGVEGGVQTRAISDGLGAKKLVYAVYNSEGQLIETISGAKPNGQFVNDNAFQNGLTETVSVTLAKGQQYTVAFWAQNGTCDAYNTDDLTNVTVTYGGALNNDETRDAFFASTTFTVVGSESLNVTMKRPFAQINLGVYTGDENKNGTIEGTEIYKDWEHAVASKIDIETSKVVINNAATSINLLDGSVSGSETVTYKLGTIPAKFKNENDISAEEWLEVDTDGDGKKEHYKYLSMSYILVDETTTGAAKANLESLQFTFHPNTGNEIVFDQGLTNVPVQRNWRTNIIGQILTGDITFNITIDQLYDGDFNIVDGTLEGFIAEGVSYDATADAFTISNLKGLKWLSEQSNSATKHAKIKSNFAGQTIKLTGDIDFSNETETWTPISAAWANNFAGVFDGGNHTISNLKTTGSEAGGLFGHVVGGTVKNVNITYATISGTAYSGAIAGQLYNATVENCRVENSAVNATSKWGRAAGIASMLTNSNVNNCSVVKTNISCPASVGGLVGITAVGDGKTADQFTLKDNTLSDVNVVCDQTTVETSATPNAGELVGRRAATLVEENNTLNNVNVYVIKGQNNEVEVSTVDDLKAVAAFVNAGNDGAGLTIKIEQDIDLENKEWTPIGNNAANRFRGSIDGNGKTISNLKVNASNSRVGLIGCAGGGTKDAPVSIKNLTINNAEVSGTGAVAAVVGWCDVAHIAFSGIKVTGDVKLHAVQGGAGAVLGQNPNGAVYASDIVVDVNEGSYVSTEGNEIYHDYVGGVFGQIWGSTFKNIVSNIDVICGNSAGAGGISGGATGTWENISCSGDVKVLKKNMEVKYTNPATNKNEPGAVKWYQTCGTVIGYHGGVTYTDCTSTGTLTYSDGSTSNDMTWINSVGTTVEDSRFGASRWSTDDNVVIND